MPMEKRLKKKCQGVVGDSDSVCDSVTVCQCASDRFQSISFLFKFDQNFVNFTENFLLLDQYLFLFVQH